MYKLVNIKTGQEAICNKIQIENFDYYVSDETLKVDDNEIFGNTSLKYGWNWGIKKIEDKKQLENEFQLIELTKSTREKYPSLMFKKVIATSNPNIDIPQIIDYIDFLADEWVFDINGEKWSNNNDTAGDNYGSYKQGYNESQKTYQFTENDIIAFAEWCSKNSYKLCANGEWILIGTGEYKVIANSTKELLQLWKSQQPKTIYYDDRLT